MNNNSNNNSNNKFNLTSITFKLRIVNFEYINQRCHLYCLLVDVPSFLLLWEGLECTGGLPEGQGSRVSLLVVYMVVVPLKQFQGILVTNRQWNHNRIPTSSCFLSFVV